MTDDETKINLGVAFGACHTPEGDHLHLSIINLPHGFAESLIAHLNPVLSAAVVEFFDGLDKTVDRSKMQ